VPEPVAKRLAAWAGRFVWLVPVLAVGLWLAEHRAVPWALLVGGDEMEYADVARRIARGDGFTTSLIYPAELDYGVSRDHPSLVRAPLWPLVMAIGFVATGPEEPTIHVVLLALFAACVAAAAALGKALAGPLAGALAGIAVATEPSTRALSFLAGTETLYALLALLAFLLMARGSRPAWLGGVCALAYLTRYNGAVLFPIALLWAFLEPRRWQAVAWCVAGFAAVALPWWIRNLLITGDPFFTYYRWGLFFSPYTVSYSTTLLNMIEPRLDAPWAMDPREKFKLFFPMMVERSPFVAANAAACVGLALAALKRDRESLLFVALAAVTTVGLAFVLARGRYFAPLFPVLLALGVAGWRRHGGRFSTLGLALLLAAPWLPPAVEKAQDLALFEALVPTPRRAPPPPPWAPCLGPENLVMGDDASRLAWVSDATTLWMPASAPEFWQIADGYPVEFFYVNERKDVLDHRFAAAFETVPGCGPDFYRRRQAPDGAGSP
jgi:4-amino-4-deoxy-L-arabinose transferase-like glycosyltransferase